MAVDFPTLTPPFIITTIMLAISYVIYVVLTQIDNDYRNVDSRCKFEFMILKYVAYGMLYVGLAIGVFFMHSMKNSGKPDMGAVDYLGWVVAIFVTAYAVITSYIHIHSLRKFKKAKSESDAGKQLVSRAIESLAIVFSSRKAFCDSSNNRGQYPRFCDGNVANVYFSDNTKVTYGA